MNRRASPGPIGASISLVSHQPPPKGATSRPADCVRAGATTPIHAEAAGRIDPEIALKDAFRFAAEHGLRVTANRRRVLECLLHSEHPMSAYTVLRRLRVERPRTAPLSVYRALDFLSRHDFISRIELLNAYVARLNCHQDGERQVLVCAACGLIEEIGDHAIAGRLRRLAQKRGFRIDRQIVELSGICARCNEDPMPPPEVHLTETE
jgi:Fur family transcriptional regulator, zinc uptake regulator